jgi:hypothetical protein
MEFWAERERLEVNARKKSVLKKIDRINLRLCNEEVIIT